MAQDPPAREHYVYVPVPLSLLPDVHTLLSKQGVNAKVPEVDEPAPAGEYTPGELTQDEVRHLKREYDNRGVHAILDALATHPGEWVPKQQLVVATGRSDSGVAADLGALTQACKRIFRKNQWPMTVKGDANGLAIYRMSAEVARWWKEA